MGHLKSGEWTNDAVATSDEKGKFVRESSQFLDTISTSHDKYQPEANRYHLYVSYACPWAHRTLIVRKLKNLEDIVSVDVVHPDMLEHSWTFSDDFKGATGDSVHSKKYLYQIYQEHDSKVTTKVTVPVLWDKKTNTIVNNESSEIIRILNTAFDDLVKSDIDIYPDQLRLEIDKVNELVYEPVNNGVYKTGFAKNQQSYESAFKELFSTLDQLENRLEGKKYLVGDQLTEADIRLITTLIRFDSVYYVHFKCNFKKISEYPNLNKYLNQLYQLDAVKSTTELDHIKRHYYYSHEFINPYRIVPLGPSEEIMLK